MKQSNATNRLRRTEKKSRGAKNTHVYLGHANRCVLETLLDESDAHRFLALFPLEQNGVSVEDAQL